MGSVARRRAISKKLRFEVFKRDVIDAAEIARVNLLWASDWERFRYFCGVCWHKVRDL